MLANALLPIHTVSDYVDIKNDAKIQVNTHAIRDRVANTINKRRILTDDLPVQDLVTDILGTGVLRRMTSAGAYVLDGDAGGVDGDFATLSEGAKCLVDSITATLNDNQIFKDDQMAMWFKYVDIVRKDRTEDESLSFY